MESIVHHPRDVRLWRALTSLPISSLYRRSMLFISIDAYNAATMHHDNQGKRGNEHLGSNFEIR